MMSLSFKNKKATSYSWPLKEHGLADQAKEMRERITQSGSYGAALCIIGEYVDITAAEQTEEMDMQMQ